MRDSGMYNGRGRQVRSSCGGSPTGGVDNTTYARRRAEGLGIPNGF